MSILYPYLVSDQKETKKEVGVSKISKHRWGTAPMRCCHSKMHREGLRYLSTIFCCEFGTPGEGCSTESMWLVRNGPLVLNRMLE